MSKNAAAYIRVSTNDQTEYSPEAQLKAIKAYCKANDITLDPDHIYTDEGKSGRKAEKRPKFMEMISSAKRKPAPFDIILVHRFDRFARNRTDSVVYKSLLLKECGIKVISVTETIENDKFSIIMESMLEAMAEYYSINLSEEVKKGMTEKATRGEPLSIAPFGYKMVNKHLVPDGEKADIVKEIFNDFKSGIPYLKIAQKLNQRGIRTTRGNLFENRTVEYILRNPVYCGYIRWNPTEKTRRDYNHPDLMIVKGTHTPIIDEQTFNEVKMRADKIKETYRKYYKPQYKPSHWLVGLVTCSACGSSLVNSGGYFVCNASVKGQCLTRNSIKAEKLENLVIKKLTEDANSDREIITLNTSGVSESVINKYNKIQAQIKDAQKKLQRVKISYEKGIDSLEEYGENKARIRAEINSLTNKLNSMPINNKVSVTPGRTIFPLLTTLTSNASHSEKNAAAKQLIKNIVYDKSSNFLTINYFF